jgi:hypothetical protein
VVCPLLHVKWGRGAPYEVSDVMVTQDSIGRATRRLLGEYLAMPGLSLTVAQTQRLLALDTAACRELLAVLAQTGCLVPRRDGRYVRPPAVELATWRRAVQTVLSRTGGVGAVVAPAKRAADVEAALVSA